MLTKAWTQLRPHALQSHAWRTPDRFVALACGRGSGKTELARRRIVRFLPVKKPWDDPIYFYALPTYAQAKRVAWNKLVNLIPTDWLKGEPRAGDMVIETKFGSKLYVVGMDKPQRIEGDQWDGCVIDESCDIKPGAFSRSVLPALEHRNGWCWRIGVPKRYGIGAEEFKEFFDKGTPGSGITALNWPSSDILTKKQLAWAMENLDPADFLEQYGAQWQSIGGSIFHAFHEEENVDDQVAYDANNTVIVGSDFNVNPMCWVMGHAVGKELHIFDELFIRNTSTEATLKTLAEKLPHDGGWQFYGDATGAARKTSAATSDYLQIRNSDLFPKATVHYPKANPRVLDRFAACNALACNAHGQRRLKIHPRCQNLIRDLKYRKYKEGTREPDDYGDLGHITDALGYIVARRFPLRLVPHDAPVVSIN